LKEREKENMFIFAHEKLFCFLFFRGKVKSGKSVAISLSDSSGEKKRKKKNSE
jgi:hypothetical protein